MFVSLGALFITFEGTSALEGLYASWGATDLAFTVERWVSGLSESLPLSLTLALLAVALLAVLLYRRTRRGRKRAAGHEG